MSNLTALAERLERATEGSRELDGDIALALPHKLTEHLTPDNARYLLLLSAPPFSTSIDAALTLVPKGWQFDSVESAAMQEWWVVLGEIAPPYRKAKSPENGPATLALALCIAALRARSAGER